MCGAPMPGQPGAVPIQATSSVDAFSHVGAPYASAPLPPKQPDPQFESLFRQPEGVVNPHSHTKLLPPVQGGGLPRTAAFQPGPVIPQQNPGSTEEWPRYGGGDEARR